MVCPDCGYDSPGSAVACLQCGSHRGRALIDSGISTAVPLAVPTAVLTGTLAPGQVFASRFRIDRLLGAGGMGAVYQAWDQELDIPIALKIVRPEFSHDPTLAREFEERFKRELLTARRVTHRNVIRIHDLGESAGVKFITMQYVNGTDLASVMREGRLPFARTLSFAKQIAAGLRAAHEVGIVHRDLKPQNVLVDAADTAYVSDFGLAKSLELTRVGLTHAGDLIGTPRYISPEQIRGHAADQRSDLYALGLIMYEMATGRATMTAATAIDLMYKRVQEPAPDPQRLVADLPEYFRCAVLRCLEREPDARYQTAAALLADLESGHAAAVPRAARTVALTVPVPQLTSRRVAAVGAALVVMLTVAVPVTWRYWSAGKAASVTTTAAPRPSLRLAVLPFDVAGDAGDFGPLAVGVTESLSARLFGLPGVTVASAGAVQQASSRASKAELARDVGAAILVSGAVQGAGTALRITVTVDDAVAGRRLWAKDFSGVPGDLLTLEDQIYNELITMLGVTPTAEQLTRAIEHPTENLDAYQLYLRGRTAMRGQQERKNVEAALGYFEQALKGDPMFALAYAGIADADVRMYRFTKEPEWAQKAVAAAQQAQRLDDKLVEVHLALASAYQATGKAAEAIAILASASKLAPGSDDVLRRLGRAYLSAGRGPEAVAAYEQAVAVNPYYWVSYTALGNAYRQVGQYDKWEAALKKAIELEPANSTVYNDLGAAYLQMGRYDESAAALRKAAELQPNPETYTNLAIAYAYAGRFRDAVPMFEKSAALSPNGEQFVGNLADGYRWAGDSGRAAAAYDRAIALALKALQVNPRDATVRGNLAMYYAKRGDEARARRLIADARAIDRSNINLAYAEATIDALGGRNADALAALSEAIAGGYPVAAAQRDPDLRGINADPRFDRLTAARR